MLQKVNGKLMFTDAFYSFGKKFVLVYLPGFSTLYFGLGSLWGFPAVDKVVGSCAVLATFIGLCLGVSSKNYDASDVGYDGALIEEVNEAGGKVISLEVDEHPDEIVKKKSIKLKVSKKK